MRDPSCGKDKGGGKREVGYATSGLDPLEFPTTPRGSKDTSNSK